MVRDIKAHAADFYSGYLSTLSASTSLDRNEPSVRQLIASLHGKKGEDDPDPFVTEKIWQSRLVLQLAEVLAGERLEINKGLSELNRAEQSLFKALKGEADDDDGDESDGLVESVSDITARPQEGPGVNRLLKAWSVLYAMDSEARSLLVTADEDAATILLDVWGEMAGTRPAPVVEIELPVSASPYEVTVVRDELAEVRTGLVAALRDFSGPEATADKLKQAAKNWQDKTAMMGGRKNLLAIYILGDFSLMKKFWGRISGVPVAETGRLQQQIVAVLNPTP